MEFAVVVSEASEYINCEGDHITGNVTPYGFLQSVLLPHDSFQTEQLTNKVLYIYNLVPS